MGVIPCYISEVHNRLTQKQWAGLPLALVSTIILSYAGRMPSSLRRYIRGPGLITYRVHVVSGIYRLLLG